MKLITVDQLQDLLSQGKFDELIGVVEAEWMDCKAEPYHLLKTDGDKQEVAKDVAPLQTAVAE